MLNWIVEIDLFSHLTMCKQKLCIYTKLDCLKSNKSINYAEKWALSYLRMLFAKCVEKLDIQYKKKDLVLNDL